MLSIKPITCMQISVIKLKTISGIYCLFILSFVSAHSMAAGFTDFFHKSPVINESLADRVSRYYSEDIKLPIETQKKELLEIANELESISVKFSDQPVYWFIKGLNHRNLASLYFESKSIQQSDREIHKKDIAYKKAIELDKSLKYLNASIYSTMKHGLPESSKIDATQQELSLGGNGENDSYYWYLHWSNIDQLKNSARNEEAEQAFKIMKKEMNNSDIDMSVYKALNEKIEKDTFNRSEKVLKHKKSRAVKKPEEKHNIDKLPDYKAIIITSIVISSIIGLLVVTIYEFKIKRRYSNIFKLYHRDAENTEK